MHTALLRMGLFTKSKYEYTSQLNQGVRAFMLDIYSEDDVLVLYHGVAELGSSFLRMC